MGASAIQKIEAALNKIEFMQQLEDKTQVKKLYIAAALAVVTVVFILFGFGAGLLCNFVGFVYPAFASFKALDSKNEGEERNWLIYWVVYSCFCLRPRVPRSCTRMSSARPSSHMSP